MINAEGEHQSAWDARLGDLIVQLEQVLAELDNLGLGRVALPVNEAIELARATRVHQRSERTDRAGTG